jgi:hypothetical protein
VQDITLRPGGLLVGQVTDEQGVMQAGKAVSIRCGEREVVNTTTDASGVFAAQGLRGGQYTLVTDQGERACRLWAANTAPPAARPTAVLVTSSAVARGQWSPPGWGPYEEGRSYPWLEWIKAHPYLTAGTVAAAIAIPLVFADNDDGPSS